MASACVIAELGGEERREGKKMGSPAIGAPEERTLLLGVREDELCPPGSECIPFPDGKLLEELRESDRRISANWGGLNKMTMAIGWDGYFIKRHDGWRLLGYEDEKQFRRVKGIGRSTWYKMTGIAERLRHLTMEEFLSMSIENAEQLSVQPAAAKHDPQLLRKAQKMKANDFADALVEATARRENKPMGEVYVTMKWRIRQAQREVIERGLEDWQYEHGIDDPGYALELMIAEYRDRLTLVGFMTQAKASLSREVLAVHSGDEQVELQELRTLRDSVAIFLREMEEALRICCGERVSESTSQRVSELALFNG